MKAILSTVSTLMLAGCAEVYDRTAAAPACERPAADRSPALQVTGSGFANTGGLAVPGRYLGGSGKLDKDWPNSTSCIRQEDNKTKPPKLYDLRKIGMAV